MHPKIDCLTAPHSLLQDRLLDMVLNHVSFVSFFLFLSEKEQQFNEKLRLRDLINSKIYEIVSIKIFLFAMLINVKEISVLKKLNPYLLNLSI